MANLQKDSESPAVNPSEKYDWSDDANGFLKLFGSKHLFFSAIENKDEVAKYPPKEKPKPKMFHNGLAAEKTKLDKLNSEGWGVFFTVNVMKGNRRTVKETENARAIWIDDDHPCGKPRSDFPLPPNIIVNSSPGKYHYYWLTDTDRFDEWDGVMATMVQEHGADNAAKDLARVMRLPGFDHVKGEPHKVEYTVLSDKPYSWEEIKKHFPLAEGKTDSKGNKKSANWKPQEDHIKAIIEGENFHGSLQSVIANHANNTTNRDSLIQIARGLLAEALITGKLSDERQARVLRMLSDDSIEIQEMVNWAVESTEAENRVDIPKSLPEEQTKYKLKWPPGFMGRLCREINECAPHPNQKIAIATGLGLVAGIIGRKYNVNGAGLNLYITLLAESGIGKANIKNTINKVLVSDDKKLKAATYKGHSRFTGPRAIFEMLICGLSRICVLEEAGLLAESQAGDQAGINRAILDLYTSSGADEYAGGEAYSDAKSTIPLIRSPALSIIFVSTPKSYLRALKSKNSIHSGEVARLWSIYADDQKEYLNTERRKKLSTDICNRLDELIKECADRQSDNAVGKVIDVELDWENIKPYSNQIVDLENKYKDEGDTLRSTVTSRAFMKTLKIASIISVFNGSKKIDDEAWEWPRNEAVGGEAKYISDMFSADSSDDILRVAKQVVGRTILKCLNREYKNPRSCVPQDLAKRGIIPMAVLSKPLEHNTRLKDMDDSIDKPTPKKGLEKVIEYMKRNQYLKVVTNEELKKLGHGRIELAYKITDEFRVMME